MDGRLRDQSISWPRIGAESVAIVGSILLAFAIDAWWDGVLDRRAEQELLGALATEFEGTLAELQRGHKTVLDRRDAALRLAALDAESVRQFNADQLTELYRLAVRPDRADPPTGVLNSAISSGSLSIIRNRELAALLAGWSQRLTDMRNTETDIGSYLVGVLAPDMAARAVVPYWDAPVGEDFYDAVLATSIKSHLNFIATTSRVNAIENEQLQAETVKMLDLITDDLDQV